MTPWQVLRNGRFGSGTTGSGSVLQCSRASIQSHRTEDHASLQSTRYSRIRSNSPSQWIGPVPVIDSAAADIEDLQNVRPLFSLNWRRGVVPLHVRFSCIELLSLLLSYNCRNIPVATSGDLVSLIAPCVIHFLFYEKDTIRVMQDLVNP